MARDDKPLQLRPIEDDAAEAPPVIRLVNQTIEEREKEHKPIRLGGPAHEADVSRRLDLPNREEVELRTHQPGIEVLIEPEVPNADLIEEDWGAETARRNPIPWGWFALIGLAIAGAVVWSLTRMEKADVQADQLRVKTQVTLVDEEKEEREAAQLIDRIETTLRSFFDATSVETLARLVRQPERVAPLMRAYYREKPVFSGRVSSIKLLQPITLDNRGNFWMSTVALTDGKKRNLIIEILDSGEPRIDWETLVCHQPMNWDDFVTQRPTGTAMDFRVFVEQDNFHSHEFADPNLWVSFRLTALDSEETLFGYAHAGSAEAEALLNQLGRNGGRRTSLILRLSIPEGLQSRRGVVIEKLISSRWIYLDPPDSGS